MINHNKSIIYDNLCSAPFISWIFTVRSYFFNASFRLRKCEQYALKSDCALYVCDMWLWICHFSIIHHRIGTPSKDTLVETIAFASRQNLPYDNRMTHESIAFSSSIGFICLLLKYMSISWILYLYTHSPNAAALHNATILVN